MKLIYFTASYPYGLGEQWKANELTELIGEFESIDVIPLSYAGNFNNPKKLPGGIRLNTPLFREDGVPVRKVELLKIIFHQKAVVFLKEFFQKKVYKRKSHLISWISSTLNAIRLLEHQSVKEIIKKANKNTILYFFWGRGACEFLPFIDTSKFKMVFVRMHRFDLFENVNNDYLPYRRNLFEAASIVAPSSEAGYNYLNRLYPSFQNKIELFRLGIRWNGKIASPSPDRVLRVVSCSYLSSVKRVHLMIECLEFIDFPILWCHIGDGALRNELETLILKKNVQNKFKIVGMIDSGHLLDYYIANTFDVFVNVSSSEGVPMSIMEVLSIGIPVIATNVGGNGEIVNDSVGKLLVSDPTPRELAEELAHFFDLPEKERMEIRHNAHIACLENWEVVKLTKDLNRKLQS
jgi:colanic acid/amylovoran biosynthesis glycosyltransferase